MHKNLSYQLASYVGSTFLFDLYGGSRDVKRRSSKREQNPINGRSRIEFQVCRHCERFIRLHSLITCTHTDEHTCRTGKTRTGKGEAEEDDNTSETSVKERKRSTGKQTCRQLVLHNGPLIELMVQCLNLLRS